MVLNYYKKFLKWKSGIQSSGLNDYLFSLQKHQTDYTAWFIEMDLGDHILRDILKLFEKSLMNSFAVTRLFKSGYFSWWLVTSYYTSFFAVQWINRFFGTAHHYMSGVGNFSVGYDPTADIFNIKAIKSRWGTHKTEFDFFYNLISANGIDLQSLLPSIDRNTFNKPLTEDYEMRNKWNYALDNTYFFETQVNWNEIFFEIELFKKEQTTQNLSFLEMLFKFFKETIPNHNSPYGEIVEHYLLSINRIHFLYQLLLLLQQSNSVFNISFKRYLSRMENNMLNSAFYVDKNPSINFI